MIFLSYLPTEVIIRLLSFLAPNELAPCGRLSKRFLSIIQTSSLLTYTLELGKAGLEKTYFLNFDRFENSESNPSDLLAALRKRELGWSKFAWNKQHEISVGKKYVIWEVCGSVLAVGYPTRMEDGGYDAMDVYDFGSVQYKDPGVTTLTFDKLYYDYAIDAGQDLLILVEKFTPIKYCHVSVRINQTSKRAFSRCYKLHIRSLSTGRKYGHVELNESIIPIDIPDEDENWQSGGSMLEICGDMLLFPQFGYPTCNLTIVNWKSGCSLTLYPGFDTLTCRMISETEFIIVGRRGEKVPILEYYTIYEFKPPTTKRPDRLIFSLPFVENYTLADRVWESHRVSSEALYTPKMFSPFIKSSTFLYPSRCQLLGLKFYDATLRRNLPPRSRPPTPIDIVIDVEKLRKFKDKYSLTSSALYYEEEDPLSIPRIPWKVWGPSTTRAFVGKNDGIPGERKVRGRRVLISDAPTNRRGYVDSTILDFNSKAWTASTPGVIRERSEVLTHDGVKIISSLPYREMPLPTESRIQMTAPCWMLGDDIICLDVSICHFVCDPSVDLAPA